LYFVPTNLPIYYVLNYYENKKINRLGNTVILESPGILFHLTKYVNKFNNLFSKMLIIGNVFYFPQKIYQNKITCERLIYYSCSVLLKMLVVFLIFSNCISVSNEVSTEIIIKERPAPEAQPM